MDSEEPSTFSVALVRHGYRHQQDKLMLRSALLVGTALAVLVILLKELLDTRPKTPEDISQCADIPTLAIIPSTPQNTKRARG